MARLSIRRPRYALNRKKGSTNRNGNAQGSTSSSSSPACGLLLKPLLNTSSLIMLFGGMMIGYVALPMLLANQIQRYDPQTISYKNRDNYNGGKSGSMRGSSSFSNNAFNNIPSTAIDKAERDRSRSIIVETAQSRIIQNQQLLSTQSVPTSTTPHIIKTHKLPDSQRKRIMVTGGAGFVGSHLVDKLMGLGHEVIVVDNFFTGQKRNVEHWMHHPNFR